VSMNGRADTTFSWSVKSGGLPGLRALLASYGSSQVRITNGSRPSTRPASVRLAREGSESCLLDIGPDQSRGPRDVSAAATAEQQVPTVILSDSESESLAGRVASARRPRFLSKGGLGGSTAPDLRRSLRYALSAIAWQRTTQILSLMTDLTGLHKRRGFCRCRTTIARDHPKGLRPFSMCGYRRL